MPDDPEVHTLINLALHRAKVPLDLRNRRQLIIKSISAKQRPAGLGHRPSSFSPAVAIPFRVPALHQILFLCIHR